MRSLAVLICGALFGAGVTVSGMVNPMRILNFMDITGSFDPTLIFVMAGGLIVNFIGYRLTFTRAAPLMDEDFKLPVNKLVDNRLIFGSALFGVGWGIAGFCPGPAVASLVFGNTESFVFVTAMAVGIVVTRLISNSRAAAITN